MVIFNSLSGNIAWIDFLNPCVGFEPTTTEFRSDALTEWGIRPWVQLALRFHFIFSLLFYGVTLFNRVYCISHCRDYLDPNSISSSKSSRGLRHGKGCFGSFSFHIYIYICIKNIYIWNNMNSWFDFMSKTSYKLFENFFG